MGTATDFHLPASVGAFFDNFQGFAFSCTSDHKILFMNRKLRHHLGDAQTTERFCYEVLFGLTEPCTWCPEEAALRGDRVTADLHSPRDGRWYRTIHSPLDAADGSTRFVICIDVTDEKSAQSERDLFSALLNHATDGVFLVNAETSQVVYANDTACRNLGYTLEEIKKLSVIDFGVNVPDMSEWRKMQSRLMSRESLSFETCQRRRDGTTLPVEVNVKRVSYAGRDYCISVVRDVSERVRDREALIAEKNKMEAVIAGLTAGVMMVDLELHIVFQNQTHQETQGNHEGELCYRAFHHRETPCTGCQVLSGYADGLTHRRETVAENEGKKIHLEATATPLRDASGKIIGALEIVRDITEQKRMEEELVKAKKLESLSLLAGGIAHDFNNLLAVIMGNISVALHKATEPEIGNILRETEKASMRCRQLTEQLLTFSKHGSLQCTSASAIDLVQEASEFILHGTSIVSSCDLPHDLWPIRVDEGQISQVFTNILVNAREAIPEKGKIAITAANFNVTSSAGLSLANGRYVRITIHNNGEAIPDHVLPRIFDPYFTTKKKGNGLGLATAYSIVRKHGGEITVQSSAASGTFFHIFLPASDVAPSVPERIKTEHSPFTGKRVLVMDDEPSILLMMKTMLKYVGLETLCCGTGEEAEAAYAAAMNDGKRFDLVILDLTIKGGMGGEATLEKLKALDPQVKAIVSTGYTDGDFASLAGWSGKLRKPYTIDELSKAMSCALSAA